MVKWLRYHGVSYVTVALTIVSSKILMNNFMSVKDTCLLMKMLDKPDNWDYTINGIETFCAEGRNTICPALKKLYWFPRAPQNERHPREIHGHRVHHLRGANFALSAFGLSRVG